MNIRFLVLLALLLVGTFMACGDDEEEMQVFECTSASVAGNYTFQNATCQGQTVTSPSNLNIPFIDESFTVADNGDGSVNIDFSALALNFDLNGCQASEVANFLVAEYRVDLAFSETDVTMSVSASALGNDVSCQDMVFTKQ